MSSGLYRTYGYLDHWARHPKYLILRPVKSYIELPQMEVPKNGWPLMDHPTEINELGATHVINMDCVAEI